MRTFTLRASRRGFRAHQKNSPAALILVWRRWCLRWACHSQRKVLRDVADDPHLLRDIGVTREEALIEAEKRVWEITDRYPPFV